MSAQNSPPVWRHMLALLYDTFLIIPLIMAANALLMALYVNLFMNFDTTQEILLPAGAVQVVVIPMYRAVLLDFLETWWTNAGNAGVANQTRQQ